MKIFKDVKIKKTDILLTSVPWTGTTIPLMAVPILKSVAINAGYNCVGLDLNAIVVNWTEKHQYKDKILDFFHNHTYHPEIVDDMFNLYSEFAKILLEHQPKIIGLSLFSYISQVSTKYICYFLKKYNPNVKIIIGGPGCANSFTDDSTFATEIFELKLIDHYIRGDGEQSFLEYLKGNFSYPGINNNDWIELDRLYVENLPYPDYDDYIFDYYELKAIPIVGSRGCVRKCTFCDYIEHWKKFNYRSGESIFKEMIHQNKKYGVTNFKFQDSLINGNLKEYKVLIKLLAEHNEENKNNKFTWSSYFIFRPKNTFNEELWALTAKSGAQFLFVGVESLQEHIRYHMGKHFSNEDIEFSLEMGEKYNLYFTLLFIVGYVTETEKDIEFTIEWLKNHTNYKDNIDLSFGGTLGILPNTYLDRHKEELKIVTYGRPYQKWINIETGSNPRQRVMWNKKINAVAKELGYTVNSDLDNHYILELLMNGKI